MSTENHSPGAGAGGALPAQSREDSSVAQAPGANLECANQRQDQDRTQDPEQASTDAVEKLKATTAAELARKGFGLLELADGSFLATRWTCCRPLPDLRAARAFLRQIGGAQ